MNTKVCDTRVLFKGTIQQAGGGEAGYRAGLAMQKKIRMDREMGR